MSEAVASLPVSSLIGDELITVTAETTIDVVAKTLTESGISLVAVGEPTAVEGDVLEAVQLREAELLGQHLTQYQHGLAAVAHV